MKIHLKALGFGSGAALQEHVTRRLSALSRWADAVHQVVVRLRDDNGPRGGVDKVCLIQLELSQGAPVAVHAASTDFYTAVDMATRRAERAVRRVLDRRLGF